ncbi:MAG: UvrD-helicase domain-containing protein [Deltaproteobacteria bacterium]|nr:UvrD-helicase domain-containing protein [Deltaproteobacteria bacterium]
MSEQLQLIGELDRTARQASVCDFERPLALEAGAGTGKTAVLVGRIVVWATGAGWDKHASPSVEETAARVLQRVFAITFTDRAAIEMAERVVSALNCLVDGRAVLGVPSRWFAVAPEALALRSRALLAQIDQLNVSTIHAFCRKLLAQYPLRAGVHPQFQVDADGTLVRGIAEAVVRDRMQLAYGEPGEPVFLNLAVEGIGPLALADALELLADQAVSVSDVAEDAYGASAVVALATRLVARLNRLTEALEGDGPRRVQALCEALQELRARIEPVDQLSQLRQLIDTPETERMLARLSRLAAGVDLVDPAAVDAALRSLSYSIDVVRAADPKVLPDGLRTLKPLLAEVYRRMRAGGVLSFAQLLSFARALVSEHADIRRQLRGAIDQLLVDEFQDTDQTQCDLIQALTLDDQGPRPLLFVVGDPKQSIYGWRNADLSAYERLVDRIVAAGGRCHRLSVNYRSDGAILAEVERLIAPVMKRQRGLQPQFQPLQAGVAPGERLPGGRRSVEFWVAWEDSPQTNADQARRLEAVTLAEDISDLHRRHGVPWGQLAILQRTTTAQEVYLQELRRLDIPYIVERDRSYYQRREVIDAASFVRTIFDPNDQLAALAFLRSMAIGLPDAALQPLWRVGFPEALCRLDRRDPLTIAAAAQMVDELALSAPGLEGITRWKASVKHGLQVVADLRWALHNEPADRFVERMRDSLAWEGGEAGRYLGMYRLANLDRFFRRLRDQLCAGDSDPGQLLRELRASIAQQRAEEQAAISDEGLDAVRVMTIHKAKGLTFDHVYLVGAHGEAGRRSRQERAAETGVVDSAACFRLWQRPDLNWDLCQERQDRVANAEAVRTLYVAVTRPRRRLVIAGRWPAPDKAKRPVERALSHIDLLQHRRAAQPDLLRALAERCELVDDVGARWLFCRAESNAARRHAAHRPALDALEAEVERLADQGDAIWPRDVVFSSEPVDSPIDRSERVAVAVGTVVHRVLQLIDLSLPLESALRAEGERLAAYLASSALPRAEWPAAQEACQAWLKRLATGRLLPRLFSIAEQIVGRELPLVWRDANQLPTAGSVDLLYREPSSGQLVIVDYKTDDVDGVDSARRRAESYRQQRDGYLAAVVAALAPSLRPRFEFWMLRADQCVEL